MTFAEFYAEVARLLPRGTYCVSVDAWNHRDHRSVSFSIWDGKRSHEADSMEDALAVLRAHLGRDDEPPIPDITALDIDRIAKRRLLEAMR